MPDADYGDILNILVLGANGLLGSNLYSELRKNHTVLGTFATKKVDGLIFCNLNINRVREICALNNIEIIINCIGLTNIESCDRFPEAAWQINARWVHQLAEFCNLAQIKFIQISTDHFISESHQVRDENCAMIPINQYGYTKLAAENFCLNFVSNFLILRVNFIATNRFGLPDQSLLTFFLNRLQSGGEIIGFSDVHFSPVSAKYLSEVINVLLKNDATGLFNVAASNSLSKFEFANMLAQSLEIDNSKVKSGSILNMPNLAIRPSNLSLNASKLSSHIELISIEQVIDEALEWANSR